MPVHPRETLQFYFEKYFKHQDSNSRTRTCVSSCPSIGTADANESACIATVGGCSFDGMFTGAYWTSHLEREILRRQDFESIYDTL